MPFIYHMVPDQMDGEVLFPLSTLRTRAPQTFAREIAKYDDHPQRKELPRLIIKKINLPQADLLHFTPLHPRLMFEGLRGVFPQTSRSQLFYEIPIARIEGLPAVLFDMNRTGTYVFGEDEHDDMFEMITPATYRMFTALPPEAMDFYREWAARGMPSAPTMGRIAHVLVAGPVSIAGCQVVDWREEIG